MAVSMKDLDPAFQGAGQKAGLEIWRIENFNPIPVPKSSYGKFFTGDSYVILKTTASKNGALRHDIHYWLGKDTSQDEAGVAAIKTVELDAALGGRAVQYREVQGHETEKFLSYFKPCIIPQEGGVASGFKHAEAEKHKTRLFVCRGKHVVHVKEVPFARSSLNHDDIFVLDTESKIFQFNGSNSCIQERAKALEVVQYIKDTYHEGKCEVAAIEDGKLMADSETGEFWGFFGGFAPLPRKTASDDDKPADSHPPKLLCIEKGQAENVETDSLKRELLDTNKCYILDCGLEVFVWMGRNTSLEERKSASGAADELVSGIDKLKPQIIRVIEGFETVTFRSKFDSWPQTTDVTVSEDGRGKVAALLKRQGVNVKGLLKADPVKEEPQAYIDCTGHLQVWRVNGQEKILLPASNQSKFYSGDCYIFQYSYPGEDKEDCLIGTWIGKKSVEEDRASANSLASKMVESMKFQASQARIFEGNEPIHFYTILQTFIVFKGGLSDGYKTYTAEKEIPDETYNVDGVALFRIQGSGPDNMQAIQVEPVASSLNSSYCYILHNGPAVFTWSGSATSMEDQELVERMMDLIKPNLQTKPQREGTESEQFWDLLGGKSEYPSQKISREAESDPRLFSCNFSKGNLKVTEVYNFSQDDLMTEDIFILDCHTEIFVWVGQQVDPKSRMQALTIGEKFIEHDFLLENLSHVAPIYIAMEGSEPPFFTRFFKWDSAKSAMLGDSFQRKLKIVKNGGTPLMDKPKRRTSSAYGGRSSSVPDKSQRSSRSMSVSPDRVRVRGRSPAFNALAANFENPGARNLSTPPPVVRKLYPKSKTPDSAILAPKSAAIAALTSSFEQPPSARETMIPRSVKVSPVTPKSNPDKNDKENSASSRVESLTIEEDVKEGEAEDEEGLSFHPYERLKVSSPDPVPGIDVTKRETYLSSAEFKEKFGMSKDAFYKLPKWKQNKLKMAIQLF
ncbi:villin-4-like [Lotus japonicus]|uniref:villin-4-like n=1 Tax=Lotus japonicus TaxID=34305 RepID=UPI0025859671|nr:villin-4-like [Lotus japonicus]